MHDAINDITAGKIHGKPSSWERYQRMWYNFYLFIGVGINFLIYFTQPYGFDPGRSLVWGSLMGIGIPLLTMFTGAAIHKKVIRA